MDQDTMLTTLVAIKPGPVIRIRRLDQRREPPCFQTVSDRVSTDPLFELVTKALATWENAVYPRPFSRWIKQTPREHVPAPQDLGCWGPHADSHILCRPRNRRGTHIFGCLRARTRSHGRRCGSPRRGPEGKARPIRTEECSWVNGA